MNAKVKEVFKNMADEVSLESAYVLYKNLGLSFQVNDGKDITLEEEFKIFSKEFMENLIAEMKKAPSRQA